jgi:hypothetical protein
MSDQYCAHKLVFSIGRALQPGEVFDGFFENTRTLAIPSIQSPPGTWTVEKYIPSTMPLTYTAKMTDNGLSADQQQTVTREVGKFVALHSVKEEGAAKDYQIQMETLADKAVVTLKASAPTSTFKVLNSLGAAVTTFENVSNANAATEVYFCTATIPLAEGSNVLSVQGTSGTVACAATITVIKKPQLSASITAQASSATLEISTRTRKATPTNWAQTEAITSIPRSATGNVYEVSVTLTNKDKVAPLSLVLPASTPGFHILQGWSFPVVQLAPDASATSVFYIRQLASGHIGTKPSFAMQGASSTIDLPDYS